MNRAILGVVLVATLGAGILIGVRIVEDGDPSLGPRAQASPLTFSLASTSVKAAALGKYGPGPFAPTVDLVLARGQEIFLPASDVAPTGRPDEAWNLYYYPLGTQELIHATATEESASHEYLKLWHPGMATFWSTRHLGQFLIDSEQAVLVAHAMGGALATTGYPEIEIDYQLFEVAGSPTWEIVYRDVATRAAVFTATVDAMQGLPLGTVSPHPAIDVDAAVVIANPTVTYAADAQLVLAIAVEAPRQGIPDGISAGGLTLAHPVALIEKKIGDGLAATWYLEFVSESLGTSRVYLVISNEAPVPMDGYKTDVTSAQLLASLDGATDNPRILDLEDAMNVLRTDPDTKVWPNYRDGFASALWMSPVTKGDEASPWTWTWTMSSINTPEDSISVNANTGAA